MRRILARAVRVAAHRSALLAERLCALPDGELVLLSPVRVDSSQFSQHQPYDEQMNGLEQQPNASPAWARFYNEVGSGFAVSVAPRIRRFYETTEVGRSTRTLLDVCCGTGQLARHFLDHGYEVTGLDLSDAMLDYARLNAGGSPRSRDCSFHSCRCFELSGRPSVRTRDLNVRCSQHAPNQ
jgi:tRNA/tmRNA/rRNA uracil-C5-methylase (TrmA/RlmC/RlmD family)